MINTDKYEGHTPAPWTIAEDMQSVMIPANHQSVDDMSPYIGSGANAQLIADTPLLLEAYKRLREDNKKLHDAINGCAYANMQGSAHDLYCESIVERCPTCYQNIDDMECGCEEE